MTRPVPLGGRRATVVWLTAVSVYFLAIFHRSSLGVAGLAAAERFDISAAALSTFTVLQLFVYASMQIPVGVLLDRYGPQRLLFTGAMLMTVAQLAFAFTGSFAGAIVARIFVGMGDAMVFISVLRVIAAWFPPMRSPVLTAWTALLGQTGALVAAVPLSHALSRFGWTTTFAVSACGGAWSSGSPSSLIVRDVPRGFPHVADQQDGASGRPRPAAVVGRSRHPAGALVALHRPVRGQRDGAAVGLPVLRARREHRSRPWRGCCSPCWW